jgi:hypothetical protein
MIFQSPNEADTALLDPSMCRSGRFSDDPRGAVRVIEPPN